CPDRPIQPLVVLLVTQILFRRLLVEKFRPLIAFIHPPLGPVKLLHHADLSDLLPVLEHWPPLLAGLAVLQNSVTVEGFFLRFRDEIPPAAMAPRDGGMAGNKLQEQEVVIVHSGAEVI